jgi:uncharacterized membrane protein
MAKPPKWTRRFLGETDFEAITDAIKAAESRTSAEIRVHLERRLPRRVFREPVDALARARAVFAKLGMHRTAERHGVLVYLAVDDHQLAVLGDVGIHGRVGDRHWHRVRDEMLEKLRAGAPREAITGAIDAIARELAAHYPRRPGDTNELGDEVTVS